MPMLPRFRPCVVNHLAFVPCHSRSFGVGIPADLLKELGFGPEYLSELLNERVAQLEQLEPVTVDLERRVCRSGKRVRTYPKVISFEDSHEADDVGLRGEEFVHHKLVATFGSDRVQ